MSTTSVRAGTQIAQKHIGPHWLSNVLAKYILAFTGIPLSAIAAVNRERARAALRRGKDD